MKQKNVKAGVRVKDVHGADILVQDANGTEVWVTAHHLELVTE